jgi:Ni/Co efflux regulator RcnB
MKKLMVIAVVAMFSMSMIIAQAPAKHEKGEKAKTEKSEKKDSTKVEKKHVKKAK